MLAFRKTFIVCKTCKQYFYKALLLIYFIYIHTQTFVFFFPWKHRKNCVEIFVQLRDASSESTVKRLRRHCFQKSYRKGAFCKAIAIVGRVLCSLGTKILYHHRHCSIISPLLPLVLQFYKTTGNVVLYYNRHYSNTSILPFTPRYHVFTCTVHVVIY